MENIDVNNLTPRRGFLGAIASGAAALGLANLLLPSRLHAESKVLSTGGSSADAWMNKIKGKHKIVYDVFRPHEVFPFAWPRVFLMTNEATGTPAKDCSVVVVLRHSAIGFAMTNNLWSKYHFGEVFKYDDPVTKAPSLRNPFWQPKPGDFKVPGIGPVAIGINELQDSGVMFCVCSAAMTVYSATIAEQMKLNAKDILEEFNAGILSGIHVVPSGVWAVGRAQEHGCGYCTTG